MSNKILLCVSDTGGGHRSAANAIRDAIDELVRKGQFGSESYEVVIADVVEESNPVHRLFVAIYNYLLRHRQSWMKYYYNLIELFRPDNSTIGYWLASGYFNDLLGRVNPAIVVSIHPMANHYLSRALRAIKLPHQPKLIEVILDPNAELWIGWACRDADLIIAPNGLARQRLIELGIDPARIETIGMPVNPQFLQPARQSRQAFLGGLGLKPNMVTVCLTAGWAGGGNLMKIYCALANVCKPIQVIVICGNNDRLYKEIKLKAQDMSFSTVVVPELLSLSDAMSACDLLVTKAGGLTTYEAVARRLPMAIDMLTEPMPQESGTAELLIDAGLARPIHAPSDIVAIVESLEHIENRDKLPLPTKYNLDRTDAVYEIATIILSNCKVASESLKSKAAA
jgi:UDP-N-acetylglucosamine:LPS N-acetylglucosamine transferase